LMPTVKPGDSTVQTVKQLLESKGHDVWSIDADDSVFDALGLMAEKEAGALIVMEASKPIGLISERDYARNVLLKGQSFRDAPVRDVMTRHVICARPELSVEECMRIMTEKRVRHLPVMDGLHLIGIISIGDLVKAIIAEQQSIISQLENYISG
jgi:CBS domain-containing protein